MKRILVIADTHGNVAMARKVIKASLPLDGMIHLGDSLQDAYQLQEALGLPFWAVSGNHDWYKEEPLERIFNIEEIRIFACHGHRYDLTCYCPPEEWEENLAALLRQAAEKGSQCVLFGHSHEACCERRNGMLMMNPGSMCLGEKTASYGMLNIDGTQVKGDLFQMKND